MLLFIILALLHTYLYYKKPNIGEEKITNYLNYILYYVF